MFNLDTCPDICISHPSKWRLISIQVLKMSSQLHPGPISNTHPGLEMCISIPSKSCATCITSLLHTNHVSPQHMSWLLHPTSIQVQKISSQLHPSPISPYSGLMMCLSTQSRSHLSPTQMSNPDPGHEICISPPKRFPLTCIQVAGFASQLHPGAISLPFKSENLHLNSIYVLSFPIYIQVTSHLNPGPNICIIHPSRWCLSLICITHLSRSCPTCIQNSNILISPHPCTVSFPSNPKFRVSSASMWHLTSSLFTSIQVMIFASQLHPCPISHQSASRY